MSRLCGWPRRSIASSVRTIFAGRLCNSAVSLSRIDTEVTTSSMSLRSWHAAASVVVLVIFLLTSITRAAAQEPTTRPEPDTLWVIPHTHWEGAVFKTREEYLQGG